MTSTAELTLAAQLDQAGIPYEREVKLIDGRLFRADFLIGKPGVTDWYEWPLVIEVEGGVWVKGRHVQGKGFEEGCEKQALAVIAGYRYIRASTRQVEEGECLEWIRQALGISTKEAA